MIILCVWICLISFWICPCVSWALEIRIPIWVKGLTILGLAIQRLVTTFKAIMIRVKGILHSIQLLIDVVFILTDCQFHLLDHPFYQHYTILS